MDKGIFRGLAGGALLALLVVIVMSMAYMRRSSAGSGPDMKQLGLAEFTQAEITYDGVMHELYWHYEFANQMIRVGRVEDARAHLKMLTFYINLLPYLSRDKKFFKDPEAAKQYDKYANDLLTIVDKVSANLGSGDSQRMGGEMQQRISNLCYHCHKALKTPVRKITPYGKKIEMGAGNIAPEGGRKRINR